MAHVALHLLLARTLLINSFPTRALYTDRSLYRSTVRVTGTRTTGLNVWAKLHPSAWSLCPGSYRFKHFDIQTEGWILVEDVEGVNFARDACASTTVGEVRTHP